MTQQTEADADQKEISSQRETRGICAHDWIRFAKTKGKLRQLEVSRTDALVIQAAIYEVAGLHGSIARGDLGAFQLLADEEELDA